MGSETVGRTATAATRERRPLDALRTMQLALAALWLLDGLLQLQPSMFAARAVGAPAASVVAAAVLWLFGQNLGMILPGGATDPNSGPLLILLALAYWPARPAPAAGSSPAGADRRPATDTRRSPVYGSPAAVPVPATPVATVTHRPSPAEA